MVFRETPAEVERIAFYFAQPPPIGTIRGEPAERRTGISAFRNPKRQARRDNISYLGLMNRENKAALKAWVKAVDAAVAKVREGAGGAAEG
jgi:hypothetical protein